MTKLTSLQPVAYSSNDKKIRQFTFVVDDAHSQADVEASGFILRSELPLARVGDFVVIEGDGFTTRLEIIGNNNDQSWDTVVNSAGAGSSAPVPQSVIDNSHDPVPQDNAIAQNTADISANTSDIGDNATDIAALQAVSHDPAPQDAAIAANTVSITNNTAADVALAARVTALEMEIDGGEAWANGTAYDPGEVFSHNVTQTTAVDANGDPVDTGLGLFTYAGGATSGASVTLAEIALWTPFRVAGSDINNKNSHGIVVADYDITAFPPAQPGNAPAMPIAGDTHQERYSNGLAYFTHNGTEWVLNIFTSSDDVKFTHRDESALAYVEGSLAGPQNPPANPVGGDVHMERYSNALVYFTYQATGPGAGWDANNSTYVPLGAEVNEVIRVDDSVTNVIDLPDATSEAADVKIIDVCAVSNPDPDSQGGILGGDVGPAPQTIFNGSFVPTQTGTYTLSIVSVASMTPGGSAHYIGGSTFNAAGTSDLFDLSGDPFTDTDVGTKTWDISVTAGQQVFVYIVSSDGTTVVDQPRFIATGFTPVSVAVTANGGAQPVAGLSDSRDWRTGDKIVALPTEVVDPANTQTVTQPDNAPNSVSFDLGGGVTMTRGNNGPMAATGGTISWATNANPAFTTMQNAYDGQIGDNIFLPAYQGAKVRNDASGQVFDLTWLAWQQGGGGGFSFEVAGDKEPGWCLIKIPVVGEDFQSGNFATENLTLTDARVHDFGGNIMNWNDVFQFNLTQTNPAGSINVSLPTGPTGNAGYNLSRTQFTLNVNDTFNAGAQPTTLRVGQNNSGFFVSGNRPSDGSSQQTGVSFVRSAQASYPNLTGVRVRTPGLVNGDAQLGSVLALTDLNGEVEFQAVALPVVTSGAGFTSVVQNGWMDLTFEVASTVDGDEVVTFPVPFAAAPNIWDIQTSMRNNSGFGGGGGAVVSGTVTSTQMTINRLDSVDNAENPFHIIRVRGQVAP